MPAVRLERCRPASERGDVFAGLFRVCRERSGQPSACKTLIARTMDGHLVEHISRDATAIEAREKPFAEAEGSEPKRRRKRGRPRKGEEQAKEPSRLERQLTMSLPQMRRDLPRACDVGTKRNAKGHTTSWIGYKLHVDTADGGIPISCIMASASTHDSQVAIPLGTLTAGRVENLYDLMDAAYDSIEIRAHCILQATSRSSTSPQCVGRNARAVEA